MAKAKKTVFFCQNCGYESAKWMGQCPGCREWNSFVEETVFQGTKKSPGQAAGSAAGGRAGKPMMLSQIDIREDNRIKTSMEELDRVLEIPELQNPPFFCRYVNCFLMQVIKFYISQERNP